MLHHRDGGGAGVGAVPGLGVGVLLLRGLGAGGEGEVLHEEHQLTGRAAHQPGQGLHRALRLLPGLGRLLRGGGEGGGREQGVSGGEELVLGDGEAGDGLRPSPQG